MIIRLKSTRKEGYSNKFNTYGLGEVLGSIQDDYDSYYIKDLDVYIDGEWKDMTQAFRDRDIIPDNFNIYFAPPYDEDAKRRGYNS